MGQFLGSPKVQYFNTSTGQPMSGGLLYSYDTGTANPRATYPSLADSNAGTNANTNPIVLDSRGEAVVVVSGPTDFKLTDALGNVIWTVGPVGTTSGGDIYDSNGNLALHFVGASGAVNYVTIANATTGSSPSIASTGSDSNIGLSISAKGTGTVAITGPVTASSSLNVTGTSTSSTVAATTGTITNITASTIKVNTTYGMLDSNGVPILGLAPIASAVNIPYVQNAATGNPIIIGAAGVSSDSNIGINITPKGTGKVKLNGFTYPTVDGTSNQFLASNGSGVFSFGPLPYTDKATQQTGTSTTAVVNPALQFHHASAAKAYVSFDASGNILSSYNISTVVRNSTGNFTITFANAFSSVNYAVSITAFKATSQMLSYLTTAPTVSAVTMQSIVLAGTATNPDIGYLTVFGTLA